MVGEPSRSRHRGCPVVGSAPTTTDSVNLVDKWSGIADYSGMTDHSGEGPGVPDYELDDRLELTAAQSKLLLDETRLTIIDLLSERAATTSQLADALERPKGTVGHHCKALEGAGLIHVVRTARVRAMEERYYGRVARLFIIGDLGEAGVTFSDFLGPAISELRRAAEQPSSPDTPHVATVRHARIPVDRAREWEHRLQDLADEFAAQERGGDTTYGMLLAVYETERKALS